MDASYLKIGTHFLQGMSNLLEEGSQPTLQKSRLEALKGTMNADAWTGGQTAGYLPRIFSKYVFGTSYCHESMGLAGAFAEKNAEHIGAATGSITGLAGAFAGTVTAPVGTWFTGHDNAFSYIKDGSERAQQLGTSFGSMVSGIIGIIGVEACRFAGAFTTAVAAGLGVMAGLGVGAVHGAGAMLTWEDPTKKMLNNIERINQTNNPPPATPQEASA